MDLTGAITQGFTKSRQNCKCIGKIVQGEQLEVCVRSSRVQREPKQPVLCFLKMSIRANPAGALASVQHVWLFLYHFHPHLSIPPSPCYTTHIAYQIPCASRNISICSCLPICVSVQPISTKQKYVFEILTL